MGWWIKAEGILSHVRVRLKTRERVIRSHLCSMLWYRRASPSKEFEQAFGRSPGKREACRQVESRPWTATSGITQPYPLFDTLLFAPHSARAPLLFCGRVAPTRRRACNIMRARCGETTWGEGRREAAASYSYSSFSIETCPLTESASQPTTHIRPQKGRHIAPVSGVVW